ARPRERTVIIADQRHARRKIERLAKAFQRPNRHELPELAAPAGGDGDKTPKETAAENESLAPKAVANYPGHRRRRGVNPHERRPDDTQLHLVEAELFLELGEHGGDGLAIGVIKEANQPKHQHHPPFVRAGLAWSFHPCNLVLSVLVARQGEGLRQERRLVTQSCTLSFRRIPLCGGLGVAAS